VSLMLRALLPNAAIHEGVTLDVLQEALPHAAVEAALSATGARERRRRKLPARVTLLLTVASGLFPHDSLEAVLCHLLQALRLLRLAQPPTPPTRSAICQARQRLGVAPLVALFHAVCRPLATPATRGAFFGGLRLVALDGTKEDVPDSPANSAAFGRPTTDRGPGAFPQVRAVYLVECGTHAILDAGFWPSATHESRGGLRLLRSVGAGMLLLWDRGFHSYRMAVATRAQGAHFLGRMPSTVKIVPVAPLADGSQTAWLYPHWDDKRRGPQRLLVRVISYTLDRPGHRDHGQRQRLMTSLLDPATFPALDLVVAYHERWEIELAIAELDTHQRLLQAPLRSQTPTGVLQELYALLLAYYAVRATMHAAAVEGNLDPDRLSFRNAVRLICAALPEFQLLDPAQHDQLRARLRADLRRYTLPERDHRQNPRVVRRKMSNFPLKRTAQRGPSPPPPPFRETVHLLI
jgi:transposase IS4-like protein/DDE family transposase